MFGLAFAETVSRWLVSVRTGRWICCTIRTNPKRASEFWHIARPCQWNSRLFFENLSMTECNYLQLFIAALDVSAGFRQGFRRIAFSAKRKRAAIVGTKIGLSHKG